MKLLSFFNHTRPEPLIHIEISAKRLRDNLAMFREKSGKEVAPVLKSNAYGHGLYEVANALEKEPAPFWVVDSHFEAEFLRHKGFKKKILIAGFVRTQTVLESTLKNVSFTIGSVEQLRDLAKLATRTITLHLKIDTGMHRLGVLLPELEEALALIKASRPLELEGLMSHFASADTDEETTLRQIQMWNAIVSECKDVCDPVRYVHISATAGHKYISLAAANCTRLGLGLYGILPDSSMKGEFPVKPALSMYSILSSVKHVQKGGAIGYGGSYTAPKDMVIGTVPAGYFEGIDRRLSNKSVFLVAGIACPLVGKVSMNTATIDLNAVGAPKLGMEVELISNDASKPNSVCAHTEATDVIPYELLVHIPQHLKRKVI